MPIDYIYPGSVWANASPDKVWVLLDGNWWPIPPKFELSVELQDAACPPGTLPLRYIVSMASSDDQGWIDYDRANYLFTKMLTKSEIVFSTNMFGDDWKADRKLYLIPPVRIWPVDPMGRYYQYDIRLATQTYSEARMP